jgi:hypothetical protein
VVAVVMVEVVQVVQVVVEVVALTSVVMCVLEVQVMTKKTMHFQVSLKIVYQLRSCSVSFNPEMP